MRIALALASLAIATSGSAASAERTKGLSLEQIRGVMRANAAAFNACLRSATRAGQELHGPFLYQIEVDRNGRVASARPFQPSAVAAFDRCVTAVIKRARFPGGPANVEARAEPIDSGPQRSKDRNHLAARAPLAGAPLVFEPR